MAAVEKFINSLNESEISDEVKAKILEGYENVSDSTKKPKKAEFFVKAMRRMDEFLDYDTKYKIRDSCACCKGGWREKAAKKIAKDYKGKSIEEKLSALCNITHMGNPKYNEDGTIIAGIGGEKGFPCPCSIFSGTGSKQPEEEVSKTYCLCCAGHFRYYYEIALEKKIRTIEVISSSLNTRGKSPCRFLYEIEN